VPDVATASKAEQTVSRLEHLELCVADVDALSAKNHSMRRDLPWAVDCQKRWRLRWRANHVAAHGTLARFPSGLVRAGLFMKRDFGADDTRMRWPPIGPFGRTLARSEKASRHTDCRLPRGCAKLERLTHGPMFGSADCQLYRTPRPVLEVRRELTLNETSPCSRNHAYCA